MEVGGQVGESMSDEQVERKKSRLSNISIGINIVLTVLKSIVGIVAHSDALLADAAHSLADVAGSIAVMIGLRVARRPPDANHPYGHGKAEVIAASLVAILLVLAGLEVVFSSIRQFFSALQPPDTAAFYTALFAIVVKEIIYRYQIHIGKIINSPALIAGAQDHRSDVYASIAAAVGIGLAIFGFRTHRPLFLYADPLAGLIVAIVVVRVGYRLAKESFTTLMDQVLDAATTEEISQRIQSVRGVQRVDDLRVRSNGSYWVVDVKVSVDPEITVLQGHAIGKAVKASLTKDFGQIYDVLVHINPFHDHG